MENKLLSNGYIYDGEDSDPIGSLNETLTVTKDEFDNRTQAIQVGSASIVSTPGNGRLAYAFCGLDKLYTYRIEINAHATLNSQWAANLPGGPSSTKSQQTSSITMDLICYEGLDKEISRLRIFEDSSSRNSVQTSKTATGPHSGFIRKIYFHHPKNPDDWHYTEERYSGNFSGSKTSTIFPFNGPNGTGLEEGPGTFSYDNVKLTAMDVRYLPWGFEHLYDTVEDFIWQNYFVSNPPAGPLLGPMIGQNLVLAGFETNDFSESYSLSMTGKSIWGKKYSSFGNFYLVWPEGDLWDPFTIHPESGPIENIARLWDYFAPSLATIGRNQPYIHTIAGTGRFNALRYVYKTGWPLNTPEMLYTPNYVAFHRPIKEGGPWSFIYYLPRIHLTDYGDWEGGWEIGDGLQGAGSFGGVGGISMGLYDFQGHIWPGGHEAENFWSRMYIKPGSWVFPPVPASNLGPPEKDGYNDVIFFSNVLTLEQIKGLTGKEEDFLDGIGVI
jgi:hypothetical protein